MDDLLKQIKLNLKLLFQSPKDYIYSFRYSNKRTVSVKPFNPKSYDAAKKIIRKLKKVYPGIEIYLIGSVGLKIPGRGDVDFYVTVPLKDLSKAKRVIIKLFGKPSKIRSEFIEWGFTYRGIYTELTLTYPENQTFLDQIKLFRLIKNNKTFLNEYADLKRQLNDCSEKEYVRRRMEFFNRVLLSDKSI